MESEHNMATNTKGNSVTKTISIPKAKFPEVQNRYQKLGLKGLSQYVQFLIKRDIAERRPFVVDEDMDLAGSSKSRKIKSSK